MWTLKGEPFLAGIWVILLVEWAVIFWSFSPTVQILHRCLSLLVSCPEPWGRLWWETNTSALLRFSEQKETFCNFRDVNKSRLVCLLCHQRKCIVDELRRHPELDLSVLNSGFAATLPYVPVVFTLLYAVLWCVKLFFFYRAAMIEDLSNSSFSAIQDHIQTHLTLFLKLPHYKQTYLAEKVMTKLVCTNLLVFCAPGLIFHCVPVRNPKDRQICESCVIHICFIVSTDCCTSWMKCEFSWVWLDLLLSGLFSSWGTYRWPRSGFPGTSAAFLRPWQLGPGGQRSSGSETGGDEKFLPS